MNPYFNEVHTRQKLAQLRHEGQQSQAFHRSRPLSKAGPSVLPRLIGVAVSVLVLLLVWAR